MKHEHGSGNKVQSLRMSSSPATGTVKLSRLPLQRLFMNKAKEASQMRTSRGRRLALLLAVCQRNSLDHGLIKQLAHRPKQLAHRSVISWSSFASS